jgi:hypothetical protein
MLYITLLDQFHPGIYSSQVIDVCDNLNKKHKINIRILAFLSIKELINTNSRVELKKLSPTAIIFPAFPGIRFFEYTSIFLFLICLFTGERVVICRNSFAAKIALNVKRLGLIRKVVLDGRSSLASEIEEYDVFPVDYLRDNIQKIERYAVNHADFRMAISEKLINYWRDSYGYSLNAHVVIPCTLDNKYFNDQFEINEKRISALKKQLNICEEDIVLAYSGSTAPWQSFQLLKNFLEPLLDNNKSIKVLFLSRETKDIISLKNKYGNRIINIWVNHSEVLNYLSCSDYGLLLRELSTTNSVASPTKFAEYLFAGLPVLISENLGDFTGVVKNSKVGMVYVQNTNELLNILKPSKETKNMCRDLARTNFLKSSDSVSASYLNMCNFLLT